MPRLAVLAALVLVVPSPAGAQPSMPPRPDLYKFVNIQAAPGKLPELLALYRERWPVMTANGDELPIVVRHSQGDRWDLLVIYPMGKGFAAIAAESCLPVSGNRADLAIGGSHFSDSLISRFSDVNVARAVRCQSDRIRQPGRRRQPAIPAEAAQARRSGKRGNHAVGRNFAHGVIVRVGEVKIPRAINRNTVRA